MIPDSIIIAPPIPNSLTQIGIASLAILIAFLFVLIFSNQNKKRFLLLASMTILIMGISAAVASCGFLSRFDIFPPPMLIMIAAVLLLNFTLGLSRFGRDAASQISLATLVGLQGFRFPLELVMHEAAKTGIMPTELSYSGYNFDIVTGITAILLFAIMKTGRTVPKSIIWAWNIWGSFCLVAILFIAITTSPVVRLFGDTPAHLNTWVLYFPYVWLPVVLVTTAMLSHIVIWRKLLSKNNASK